MTKFIITVSLLLFAEISDGQAIVTRNLTPAEVNNLLRSLDKKMDDTTRIDRLLRLAAYHLRNEGAEQSDRDGAALYIRNAKAVNTGKMPGKRDGRILLYESSLAIKNGNTDNGKQLANQAIRQLRSSNDEFHLALAYLELSRCYDSKEPVQAAVIKNVFSELFQRVPRLIPHEQLEACVLELISFYNLKLAGDSYPVKLDFLDHLLRSCRTLNDKVNEFWARKEIADIHYQQGKLDMAVKELLEMAKEQKAGNYPRICFTYDLLGGIFYDAGNLEKALYYSLETIKHIHTSLDSVYLGNFYIRVVNNYNSTGSRAEAAQWNLKRLNYLIAINRTEDVYTTTRSITDDLIKLHRPVEALNLILDKSRTIVPQGFWEKRNRLMSLAQCYAAVNKNEMAERYCHELAKLLDIQIKRKAIAGDYGAYDFLASFYFAAGQYRKAEEYFGQAMDDLPTSGNASRGPNINTELYRSHFFFKLDSARGNYLSAIKWLRAAQRINDTISTAAKMKQIEELKIAYATAQKDSLIKITESNIQLLRKEDELKKTKLRQGGIIRDISFAVVALLVIIMALLFNRYRLKQRTNKELEAHQWEIARQNRSLQHLVDEKEWLLKEIHHRVKNNLQIVMSLLNSQSAYIENGPALTAIHDSQHRVHAMSLIHQKLYSAANLSSIDMSFYIRELVSYLGDSFNTGQRIRFEYHIEPLEMDVGQAVPLGLILNEAITNAIKYAFPDNRAGIISISLSGTTAGHYLLSVSDNGIGMPAHPDNKRPGSLGMSLMAGLSEDLDGDFSIGNNNGTTIQISFEKDLGTPRSDAVAGSFVSTN